jgi:hypothetical protein
MRTSPFIIQLVKYISKIIKILNCIIYINFKFFTNLMLSAVVFLPKLKLSWRTPNCGGPEVHGCAECVVNADGNVECKCKVKPKNFDYALHMALAQTVFIKGKHTDSSCDSWDQFVHSLFEPTGIFSKYEEVQGKTIRERFFTTMVDDVSKRHNVGKYANGVETHPDVSPYDSIMLKMIKEMEEEKVKKAAKKNKEDKKQSSMLHHESSMCPVIQVCRPLDEESDQVSSVSTESSKESMTSKKKTRKSIKQEDTNLFAEIKEALKPSSEEIEMQKKQLEFEEKKFNEEMALRKLEAEKNSNLMQNILAQQTQLLTAVINMVKNNNKE